MILTILILYILGAIATLTLAVLQMKLLKSGKATLGYDTEFELRGNILRSRKRRIVKNGVAGFDWLPSDFVKMAFLGGLLWLLFGIMWLWFEANELINKIDGDEN
mgnify:CR=1 FL=1